MRFTRKRLGFVQMNVLAMSIVGKRYRIAMRVEREGGVD